MRLSVRLASSLDEAAFLRAQVEGWQFAYADLLPSSYLYGALLEEQRAFWHERFSAKRSHQLLAVAEAQGEVVGIVCAFSAIPVTLGECCIDQLYVLPEHKRKGVGSKLIAAAAAWCEERGSDRLVLSVVEGSKDAVKFYTALGGIARPASPWAPTCGGSLSVLEFVWPSIGTLSRCA